MRELTRDELKQRLAVLRSWLVRAESTDYRSLGVSEEAVADGDSRMVVEEVVDKRLSAVGQPPSEPCSTGRLLLLYLDENLMDGAAAVASEGFFGGFNFPPCDLWLAVVQNLPEHGGGDQRCLISWIPDAVVPRAQAGVDVNPEECLQWASDAAPALAALEHEELWTL